MLNLDESAVIPADTQTALDLIPDGEKSGTWGSKAKRIVDFKSEVMKQGLEMQSSRCVWCTLEVAEEGHRTAHRDHIAPKGIYGQWTFLPVNLAIACEYCNGFRIKGELDTVSVAAEDYTDSEFLIVHPYLDDVDLHIQFVDNEAGHPILIEGLSERGIWTIDKMSLDSSHVTKQRAQEHIFARESESLAANDLDLLKRAVDRPIP